MNMSDFNMKLNVFPRIKKAFALFSILVMCSLLCAEQFVLGGAAGWSKVTKRDGITTGSGRYGYECLELESNVFKKNQYTDLLINFENDRIYDIANNYKVLENNLFLKSNAKMGKGSALCRSNDSGLELQGNSTSLFGQEGPAGSFMIDFWISPSTVENGEQLLDWRSSRNFNGQILYQMVNISFYKNKAMVIFSNIFDGYTANNGEVVLITNRKLIPNRWSHHTIVFTEDDGILEYLIDGELECIKYMTSTGHEGGEVFPAVMGKAASLKLCSSYSGYVDDIRILRSYSSIEREVAQEKQELLEPCNYKIDGGRFESEPILTKTGSILNKIQAEAYKPSQTEVQFYVRAGDNFFNWTEDWPKWIPVESGEDIQDVSGLYFQVAADLYPDGAGEHTPSVTQIVLEYTVLPDPLPPFRLSAQKGDGSVTLRWSSSVDDTAGGYYIYYGNRPGEYLGRIAVEGESPINVGNATSYTLTGLKNGSIYYFAVATYSKLDNRVCGSLSKEVFARPTAK